MYSIKQILLGKYKTESPIERILVNKLYENNIKFETQKNIGPYRSDIVIGNLIVECDGAEFHKQPNHKRDNYLKSKGYIVKHFTGSEINRNCFLVLKEIKKIIGML